MTLQAYGLGDSEDNRCEQCGCKIFNFNLCKICYYEAMDAQYKEEGFTEKDAEFYEKDGSEDDGGYND